VHFQGVEILQLNAKLFEVGRSDVNASKLPYDPGLSVGVSHATLEEKDVLKRTIFGVQFIDRNTGLPEHEVERLFRGRNVVVRVENIPIFYLPYVQGDANDPLGPLQNVSFNYNKIFGFQTFTTWNLYNLIGIDPIPNTRWRLNADYMTERGPALGTD